MNAVLIRIYLRFQALASPDEGQQMVEYALVAAMLALGLVAGTKNLASALTQAFSSISSQLSSSFT
jgi:pilus assembly protein Flp/PilA